MNKEQIKTLLTECNAELEVELLQAFLQVEAGGKGFDPKTGKIMIQFEPHVFARETGLERSQGNKHIWDENKIDVQPKEWLAFNDAFSIDPDNAMESTSIGIPQIMGFHWKRLGFKSVGAMWDSFKQSESNQVKGLIKFIQTDTRLYTAFKMKDFYKMAFYYNGAKFKELAIKEKREPYDISLQKAYIKYKGLM
jgi:hypothetical protein